MKIFNSKTYGSHNKKVVFLLTGWKNTVGQFWIFSHILSLYGYRCITYEYDRSVLSPDAGRTKSELLKIKKDILEGIQKLKKEGIDSFAIFGTSLGSLIALMVANNSKEIDRIILNLSGADLAEIVWSWDYIEKGFKRGLLRNLLTLLRLKISWRIVSPINNVDKLKNKKILFYYAKKDEMIPFVQARKLAVAFKKYGHDYQVSVNKHNGHLGAGLINLLNFPKYIRFLNS
jgi:hypothetical protein